MTAQHCSSRPWYCSDRLVDDYKTVHRSGGDLRMLKALKIIRAIVVNVGIIAIALYSLSTGGDATIIGGIGLISLAAYNGVEIVDYQALARAVFEVRSEPNRGDDES